MVIQWRELEETRADDEQPGAVAWTELHDAIDYYQQLGINRTTTPVEIRRAYLKLANLFHPDRQPSELRAAAEKRMKDLNLAYASLRNSEQRAIYDAQLARKVG